MRDLKLLLLYSLFSVNIFTNSNNVKRDKYNSLDESI